MLSTDELIEHMKEKGITFKIVSESNAKEFLKQNNYYMKLAAYRTNYGKINDKYKNLDFAYLQDLSIIDMRLRYIIIDMCLDIEHYIKLTLLNKIETNPMEDGYEIIKKFIAKDERILKKINSHKSSEYSGELIKKYYPYFPAWVFVELISFGDLTYLCDVYRKVYDDEIMDNKFMNVIRDIRNASAHSNCIINKLNAKTKGIPDKRIFDFIKNLNCVGKSSVKNNLRKQFIYNFMVLLYVYDNIVSSTGIKTHRYEELQHFINNRVCRNAEYYKKNNLICSQYRFLKKIIDNI